MPIQENHSYVNSSESTVPKKMASGTFTHSSQRTRTLKTLLKTQRKVLNTSNLVYRMLLAQRQIYERNIAFYVRIGCVRFARYCGKMYSRHLFPYGGLPHFKTDHSAPADSFELPAPRVLLIVGHTGRLPPEKAAFFKLAVSKRVGKIAILV